MVPFHRIIRKKLCNSCSDFDEDEDEDDEDLEDEDLDENLQSELSEYDNYVKSNNSNEDAYHEGNT